MNILIVADNESNRKLLRVTLQAEGLMTWEAADGRKALTILQREKIDVIISDILMPNMDGYQLCSEVRKSPKWKTLPFIVYTSTYTSPNDEKLALAFGADKYIRTPASTQEILAALREVTAAASSPDPRPVELPKELEVMKMYSEQLVRKLEEKNIELEERTRALQESEARYRLLFDSNPHPMWVYDTETLAFLAVNDAAVATYGYAREEFLAMTIMDLGPLDDTFSLIDKLATVIPKFKQSSIWRHRTKDDTLIQVEIIAHELLFSGRPARLVLAHDVTERLRAEAERDQLWRSEQAARQEAEAANRLKDEFLAMVSHELRAPLTPILGWAELLRSRPFNAALTQEALESIERNTKVQTKLVEDLLDVSSIMAGKLHLEWKPTDLIPIVEFVLKSVRPAAEAKALRVESVLDPETPPVWGDAIRLQQILRNLLSNAIKFTPKGGHVEVRLERVGEQVQILVRDTGVGIRPEFLPYVFDRFRQADSTSTRKFGGLGLGLAIVRHLAEQHGGTVQAESPGEGQGATFRVRLPRLALHDVSDSERRVEAMTGQKPATSPPRLDGLRILVVEDEPDTRDLIQAVLHKCGAEVVGVASAAEALAAQAGLRPHVLVSDIGMPNMDGYDLIRQIRALEQGREERTPAVALTGYAKLEDRQQALAAGYQVHLAKPIEPRELVASVASLAGRTGGPEDKAGA